MLGIARTRLYGTKRVENRLQVEDQGERRAGRNIKGITMTCKGVRSIDRTGYKSREEGMYLEFDLEAVLVRLPSQIRWEQ
jgi:hypothetical protein